MSLEDLGSLWRNQPTSALPPLTTDALRERSARMAKGVKRRNLREAIAGSLGIAAVSWFGVFSSPNVLSRVGCAMLVVGQVFVLAVLWRRGQPRPAPPVTASTAEHLAHCRAELVRERDLLGSVWVWYIAPIVPGLLVWLAGLMIAVSPHAPAAWTWSTTLITVACGAGTFALIGRANRRASKRLAREIDALDAGGER
jgi:hypothetical protein